MNFLILIIFMLISALILGAALAVVMVKNLIHSALWLIASFFGVGALYLLMEAEFIAVVQVLVYVGAISILILFAIMLTRHVTGEGVLQLYNRWWIALVVAAALFGLLIVPTVLRYDWQVVAPQDGQAAPIAASVEIGRAFMGEYLLPFELASVVLLVALIGAIVVAFEERSRRRRVLTLAEEVALRQQQVQAAAAPAAAPTTPEAQSQL
jgi:NADH-quinone oxidoreductase subunit J